MRPRSKPSNIRPGDRVKIEVSAGGVSTFHVAQVSKINGKGIYLDNGEGNDETGPFDSKKLDLIPLRGLGLGSQRIVNIL